MGHGSLGSPLCTKPGKPVWSLQTAIAESSLPNEYTRKALWGQHSVSAVTTVILI